MYLKVLMFSLILSLPSAELRNNPLKWKDLYHNYNKQLRPIRDQQQVMNITLRVDLNNVVSLVAKSQVLSVKMWLAFNWTDENLSFNRTEAGVDYVRGNLEKMWIPDLIVYNSLDVDLASSLRSWSPAIIHSDGRIIWIPPVVSKTSCPFKVQDFPFDTQTCLITLGNWVYDVSQLQYILWDNASQFSTNFKPNNQWTIQSFHCKRSKIKGHGVVAGVLYDAIPCTIKLTRRPDFFLFCLVAPCFILVTTGSFTFLLPVTSGEKVSLSVTILLAMTVYVLVLMETLPPTADGAPFLGKFFLAGTVLLALSTAMAVSVTNLVSRESRPPQALQKLMRLFTSKKRKEVRSEKESHTHDNEESIAEDENQIESKQDQLDWHTLANMLDKFYFLIYVLYIVLTVATFLYVQITALKNE